MYGDCVIYLMLCHALNDLKSLDGARGVGRRVDHARPSRSNQQ